MNEIEKEIVDLKRFVEEAKNILSAIKFKEVPRCINCTMILERCSHRDKMLSEILGEVNELI